MYGLSENALFSWENKQTFDIYTSQPFFVFYNRISMISIAYIVYLLQKFFDISYPYTVFQLGFENRRSCGFVGAEKGAAFVCINFCNTVTFVE